MPWRKSKIFLLCSLGFIFGIGLASFSPWVINASWWFGIALVLIIVLVLFRGRPPLAPPCKRRGIVLLLGVFLFLGMWRYDFSRVDNYPDKVWYYNGSTIKIQGVISEEPDLRIKNQKLTVDVSLLTQNPLRLPLVKGGEINIKVQGKILITANLYPAYNYGDKIEATCQLAAPKKFNDFDYDRYLARYDIYSLCNYPKLIKIISSDPSDGGLDTWFYKKIFYFKNKIREQINLGLTEPGASLGSAIILGGARGIGDDLVTAFSQTGLTHIMAVSGTNVTILVAMIMWLLLALGFWRQQTFYISTFLLFSFIIMVGAPASAVRAGIMGFLILLAMHLGRLSKLINSLVMAGAVMLVFNPKILRDDVGFQLSFLAVLGIIYIFPIFKFNIEKIPRIYPILKSKTEKILNQLRVRFVSRDAAVPSTETTARRYFFVSRDAAVPSTETTARRYFFAISKVLLDILLLTISVEILTLPIIAFDFNQISLIAPLANMMALWAIFPLMLFLFFGVVLSFIFPAFAFLFFAPANVLLKYIIMVVGKLAALPYASVETGYVNPVFVVIYYGIIILVVRNQMRRERLKNLKFEI
jgi:competence protein ComEC